VTNLMGGLGGVLAFLGGGLLYKMYRPLPFWFGGAITLIAVTILFWEVKKPKKLVESAARREEGLGVFRGVRDIPPENVRSLVLLVLAIFFWFVGYNAIETFFSSYGVATLGVSEPTASMILSVAYVTFILFSIPSGFIATRFGRKRTIIVGLAIFTVLLVIAFFTPVVPVVALLAVGGLTWSLGNVSTPALDLPTPVAQPHHHQPQQQAKAQGRPVLSR
jgi:maltose/moltooligosaccharide transporter